MSTPIREDEQYSFPAFEPDRMPTYNTQTSSDEDGTLHNSDELENEKLPQRHPLQLQTSYVNGQEFLQVPHARISPMSPSQQREQSRRLDDDLEMLRAERMVSNTGASQHESVDRSRSMARSRSRTNVEPIDDFDVGTTPLHERTKIYQPPERPTTKIAKIFKRIHESSFLVRYFFYITPVVLVFLIPLLLGAFVFTSTTVGDVQLIWFAIWLEILWLTLWAGRILAKCLPYPMGLIASMFTNNDKKWRDLGKQLEIPATLFFWLLAVEISFLPTMTNHHANGDVTPNNWEVIVNKIIVSFFTGAVLNLIEKIIIQLIAISFHLRTYADRIEINKFQIGSLVKLYTYSKEKIAMEDSEFEVNTGGPASGTRTPMAYINKAGRDARRALNRVGDVAGKVAGDFTGRAVTKSTHPQQVILSLLGSTGGSQVLARRLYRTFAQEGSEVIFSDDLRSAFDNNDEGEAAFTMFDKDLNGDISMEELEAVCVEIGRERKAIIASLKDLDSVVSKLDDVFLFIVAVIVILVFVSLISTSAAGVLTSLGSSVLALSWLFSATAQEFLQSCIFVFVKHPFDVGDRVTIYGNTGANMKGDDYFVKEISLLYTEFKKMEGHVVQAPNSYLNTLFILNQRRSGGLAEAVPVTIKFGTSLEQIDTLRQRLLEFVGSENREYQHNILTELTTVFEAYSISLNVVFFYKSSWQNELLRLQRRNKFICALMVTMQELGIEGPRQNLAGQSTAMPVYLSNAYPQMASDQPPLDSSRSPVEGPGPRSGSLQREGPSHPPQQQQQSIIRNTSIAGRARGESLSAMGKRVDFSLGMSSISSGADMGDVYDRPKTRIPIMTTTSPSPQPGTVRRSQDSQNLARTTSLDSKFDLGRVNSDTSQRTHRNRFFGRSSRHRGTGGGGGDTGTDLDDLEAGTVAAFTEMPDIPEGNGSGEQTRSASAAGRVTPGRLDPRTGIVSPQAVARDSAVARGDLPMSMTIEERLGTPRRAQTDPARR